jgi:hypothetical protein
MSGGFNLIETRINTISIKESEIQPTWRPGKNIPW